MPSIQTLSDAQRRLLARWAADCAERVLPLFDADEIDWQTRHLGECERSALQQLPPLGADSSGPLGPGLLSRGILGSTIREIQAQIS